MDWTLAPCLVKLRNEVNAAHPNRPKQSDGTIGDTAHQHETSDHNPNSAGIVTAFDITTDSWSDALAESLRLRGPHDGRVKYVIWQRRITSAVHGWQWVAYNGADPHTSHIHLSVSADAAEYNRTDAWGIGSAVARNLKEGDSGDDVRALQGRLNARHYGNLVVDGSFGPKTTQAVRTAQAAHSLTVDGVVGPNTRKVLGL
jgi:murein L,D-transpeptidase YcbB/YkuD